MDEKPSPDDFALEACNNDVYVVRMKAFPNVFMMFQHFRATGNICLADSSLDADYSSHGIMAQIGADMIKAHLGLDENPDKVLNQINSDLWEYCDYTQSDRVVSVALQVRDGKVRVPSYEQITLTEAVVIVEGIRRLQNELEKQDA